MRNLILGRLLTAVPTVALLLVLVFSIFRFAPGDPARLIAGEEADQTTVAAVRRELGLDRPVAEQLALYALRVVQFDFGRSLYSGAPVGEEIASRMPATLALATSSVAIALMIGIPLGVVTAVRQGSVWDVGVQVVLALFVAIPSFALGLVLILVFGLHFQLLPIAGAGGPQHAILPAVTLALLPLALTARLVRAGCLEVLRQDFVRTARAKGLPERIVLGRHVLRNALLPTVTLIGLQLGQTLGGSVVVESVFAWPGVGRLLVESIFRHDYPVVQGGLLVVGLGFVLVNLAVDVTYANIDPRIRVG